MYVLSTGCQWDYIPKDLPPKSTIFVTPKPLA
jgi:transposase